MTRTRTLAAATTAGLLALTLAACSQDTDDGSTETSSSTGSSSTASPTPQDRSKQIFDSYTPREEVLATTSGDITIGVGTSVAPVKFAVTSVRATSESTILRYELSSASGKDELLGMSARFWYDMPTLEVPGSDKKLQSVTASLPEGKRDKAQERCVCTSTDRFAPDPRPQMVMYPPLPEDATEVTITLDSLDPVSVPVTR